MSEKLSIRLIVFGISIFGISIILFLWKDFSFTNSKTINAEKFNQFGGFIAGVVGSIWSLASIILFYVTLKEQRKDFANNTSALNLQVRALEKQIEEFELQRNELQETRTVFQEQTNTQNKQRFENTFFQLLNFHNQIVIGIDVSTKGGNFTGRDCFKHFYEKLELASTNRARRKHDDDKSKVNIIEMYYLLFDRDQSDLSHYFRHLYHIIKFVNSSNLTFEEQKSYTNFVRAQLSSYELIMLYYNGLSKYGQDKFKPLIEKFSILKNLNTDLVLTEFNCTETYSSNAFR